MHIEALFTTIGNQIDSVLFIDNLALYKGKMLGPKIWVMVEHLESIPKSMIFPRFNKEGKIELKLVYNGLPSQCP
jgi:hypothetical protein